MTEALSSQPDASERELMTALLKHIRENGAFARLLKGAAYLEPAPATPGAIAGDLLYGADQIATFLGLKSRRKVYNLVEMEDLPHFRLGTIICSRKSVLLEWIANQEGRAERQSP